MPDHRDRHGAVRRLRRRHSLAYVTAALILLLSMAAAISTAATATAPAPLLFPDDDGPHDALTEWWYFSGHLDTPDGALYGFHYVFFKATRGLLRGYAAHVAITDNARDVFAYDQRAVVDDGTIAADGPGFDLRIGDWSMRGADGRDRLQASLPGYAFDLTLISAKPPVLHGSNGYAVTSMGAATYYYSRTRLAVAGTLTVAGNRQPVTGEAWMDHQWGDFTALSGSGWDWFALQLADDTELMVFIIRDQDGAPSLVAGSYVLADGSWTGLNEGQVMIEVTAEWTSPHSGATYPAAWIVHVPREGMRLTVTPTQPDQELDTRRTTLVTYWEGQVLVDGVRGGEPIAGRGHVELTGYTRDRDPFVP